MADIKLRECVIRPVPHETKPSGWIPEARVFLHHDGQAIEQEILAPDGVVLPTKKAAEDYSVAMAVRWVDKTYPL